MKRNSTIALLALWALYGSYSKAADNKVSFDFEAGAGMTYDSNAGIPDIDANTGASDQVRNLNAGITATIQHSPKLKSRLSYDYSDADYDEFSVFDLALQHALADISYKSGYGEIGLTADYFDGELDGSPYLTLTQLSPSIARLFNNKLYTRAAVLIVDKTYDSLPERDASAWSLRGDAYYLLDGMSRYLAFGLTVGAEDAQSAELDYETIRVSTTYAFPLVTSWFTATTKLRAHYEERDYENITVSIGTRRNDSRLKVGAVAEIPLGDTFGLETSLDYSRNDSNFPAADLNKLVTAIRLTAEF